MTLTVAVNAVHDKQGRRSELAEDGYHLVSVVYSVYTVPFLEVLRSFQSEREGVFEVS